MPGDVWRAPRGSYLYYVREAEMFGRTLWIAVSACPDGTREKPFSHPLLPPRTGPAQAERDLATLAQIRGWTKVEHPAKQEAPA